MCQLAAEGVDVIFGPSSIETSGIVGAIAEKFEIPHIIFHWKTKPLYWKNADKHRMTLNFYPDSDTLAEAFANVLVDYSWKSYTVVYENKENLIRLKDVLQIHGPQSLPITLRKLDDSYGLLLKEIYARGDVNIVLDISAEKIVPFLEEAANVKMLSDYNNYFITNLDTHTLPIAQIPELASNITCLRIVDPNSEELSNALRVWRQRELLIGDMDEKQVPHEAGLVHDALQVYFNALQRYGDRIRKYTKTRLSCNDTGKDATKNKFGYEFLNFLKTQDFEGVTGRVEFNNEDSFKGSRTQFKLEILELPKKANSSFGKIGYWDTTDKVKYDRELKDPEQQVSLAFNIFVLILLIGRHNFFYF